MRLYEFTPLQKAQPVADSRVREAAVAWAERAMVREHPEEEWPEQLAEALVAIAEKYNVSDELLIEWIHKCSMVTAGAWRAWCQAYDEQRRKVNEAGGGL